MVSICLLACLFALIYYCCLAGHNRKWFATYYHFFALYKKARWFSSCADLFVSECKCVRCIGGILIGVLCFWHLNKNEIYPLRGVKIAAGKSTHMGVKFCKFNKKMHGRRKADAYSAYACLFVLWFHFRSSFSFPATFEKDSQQHSPASCCRPSSSKHIFTVETS